jgi:hypothetical protein
LNANDWIRQVHRWLAVTFTLAVLLNFAVMGRGDIALWVGYATLAPLFLLLFTGLYMFALPHVAKWRGKANPERRAT